MQIQIHATEFLLVAVSRGIAWTDLKWNTSCWSRHILRWAGSVYDSGISDPSSNSKLVCRVSFSPILYSYKIQKMKYCWHQSSLFILDKVQNRLCVLMGDELFSALQPLYPETKHCKPHADLSIFPWKVFRRITLFRSKSSNLHG